MAAVMQPIGRKVQMLKGLFYFGFSMAYIMNGALLFLVENPTRHVIAMCVLSVILVRALDSEGT